VSPPSEGYDRWMGRIRRAVVASILVGVAGLSALLGLPFIVPIVDAVARRKAPESGQVTRRDVSSIHGV
jgi:hypothetical protein